MSFPGDYQQEHKDTEIAADSKSADVPALNKAQRLHLRVSCEYMDKILQKIEDILHAQDSSSPFALYQVDISPAQGRVLEDYIRRFRSQLLRVLAWQQIEPPPPGIPATRSITTHLHFIDIAISELRPNAMRGSGPIAESTAAELTGVLRELSSISQNMMAYMSHDLGESLQERIGKLSPDDQGLALLQQIERVVTGRGLVEFRPRIDMLLSRLEDPTFEVAVFGRVSTGKSTFLNALLGMDLLPVGINPITAVPTRIQYGAKVEAHVRLGGSNSMEVTIERFRLLVSEIENPGNQEGVGRAVIEAPAARLAEGIVLVDTPGLGSLALRGARETLAYLPSCDMALLLIDAGNTLTLEDIGTLRLILEAGIPALVLLSKADLLRESDRVASTHYIQSQIEHELRAALTVHAISSLPEQKFMVDDFYERELEPRFRQSHELRRQSVSAKLERLRRDVVASLESRLRRFETAVPMEGSVSSSMERTLTEAAGQLGIAERTLEDSILQLGAETPELITHAGKNFAAQLSNGDLAAVEMADIAQAIEERVQGDVGQMIALLQLAVQTSVATVKEVGRTLQSSGLPEEGEIVGIIRDAPRFELPRLSGTIDAGIWKHLGVRVIEKRLIHGMDLSVRPLVHKELANYSRAMEVWARGITRNIQFAVNSFADVYRASIQERNRSAESAEDAAQIREDITTLSAQ